MSPRYSRLSATTDEDPDRELNEAFASDDEDCDHESTPLNSRAHAYSATHTPVTHASYNDETLGSGSPGGYDFERDYDHPPPGSPPALSSFALPNNHGNSNGQMPTSPISLPRRVRRGNMLSRAMGALLPTHYTRVPTSDSQAGGGLESNAGGRVVGGGTDNDGVFSNVAAKPCRMRSIVTDEGDVRLVPEIQQQEAPPTYASVQADAVPAYWENTIHVPAAQDPDLMIINDLPAGTLPIFLLNCAISFLFQFVGFFLTYVVHATHAAKYGSRAGLGLTLIRLGYYSYATADQTEPSSSAEWSPASDGAAGWGWLATTTTAAIAEAATATVDAAASPTGAPFSDGMRHMMEMDDNSGNEQAQRMVAYATKEWIAFLLMAIGWVLLLSSAAGFWRVKRWESSLRSGTLATPITTSTSTSTSSTSTTTSPTPTPEQLAQETQLRHSIFSVFGLGSLHTDTPGDSNTPTPPRPSGRTRSFFGRVDHDDEMDGEASLPLYHESGQGQEMGSAPDIRTDEHGRVIVIPDQRMLQEARLTRDLRAAGLI